MIPFFWLRASRKVDKRPTLTSCQRPVCLTLPFFVAEAAAVESVSSALYVPHNAAAAAAAASYARFPPFQRHVSRGNTVSASSTLC